MSPRQKISAVMNGILGFELKANMDSKINLLAYSKDIDNNNDTTHFRNGLECEYNLYSSATII